MKTNKAMRFLIRNSVLRSVALWGMCFLATLVAMAQVPDAPNPPRLVNDFAGILSSEQNKALEDSLVAFNRKTSNQICVVFMTDLGDMPVWQMAQEIGAKWGVGNKRHKGGNGLVILIKPKTIAQRGEAFIASGYGLEGVLPDAFCRRIVENEMIPRFKENDYYGGVVAALRVILPVAAGEYSEAQYDEDNEITAGEAMALLVVVIAVVVVLLFALKDKNNNDGGRNRGGGYGGPFITFGPGFGGGSHGGGFSSGGFGGFGGGGFGGGGAGGSW